MAESMRDVSAIERTILTVYCVITWLIYAFFGIKTRGVFGKATKEEQEELSAGKYWWHPPQVCFSHYGSTRDRFWNLSKQWEGLAHQFIDLSDGFRMHYVTNATTATGLLGSDSPIVIFFHGFPDSWAVWRHVISNPLLKEKCIIVAPDLPGYGGSDSLPEYGPDDLLGRVASFVIDVCRRYEQPTGGRRRAIIVAHDWGAAIAFRLASEAPQLADRFIIANGPLNYNSLSNFEDNKARAIACLKQFKFHEAKEAARPVLRQLMMSHYVVLFQSPFGLLRIFSTIGNYAWIRLCHRYVSGQPATISTSELQEFMAATLGPDSKVKEIATEKNAKYSASVSQRSNDFVLKHPMRYYREGAFTRAWQKSRELKASLGQLGSSVDAVPSVVNARTTVIWGMNDIALSTSICLKNLDKYLAPDSHIVELPRSGHGIPVEPESRVALTKTIEWVIGGEEDDIRKVIASVYPDARITARR
ncbi:hypothetical protein KEM54_004703 [Ascosphaera aggregata]|nr:hypothetical protein KEM54_004703 [Ascosphaera aggregata]